MRGKAHSDEVKAQVIAALLAGQGVNEVARRYKLDSGLVSRWKKGIPEKQLQQVAAEKREKIGDLIESHLTETLKAAASIARRVNENDEWFYGQDAAQIGTLYGILTDKAVRILEAIEAANEDDTVDATGGAAN